MWEKAPLRHGVIRFSHLYDCRRNILTVNVLSAKGILASENAGAQKQTCLVLLKCLCCRLLVEFVFLIYNIYYVGKKNMLFVEVLLLPTDLFHKAAEKQYKTEMKKQSHKSFFNCTFDM